MSVRDVQRIERGENMTLLTLARFVQLLGVTPVDLLAAPASREVRPGRPARGFAIAQRHTQESGASVLYGMLRGTALGELGTLLDLGTSSPPGAAPSPSICWPTSEWRLPGEGSPTASSRVLRVSPWDESESPIGRASTLPAHRTIRGPS
ncbi:MAG: hypothetical protein IT379_24990 [Deltaproteobacteria bacterium]|nr:hypothetical protein [Deltaproteobacteria bacterium]